MSRIFFITYIDDKPYSVLEQEMDEDGNVLRDRFWCAGTGNRPQMWSNDARLDTKVIRPYGPDYIKITLCRAKKFIREFGGKYRDD